MKKTIIQYLDTLRALATLGVIMIHISSPVLKMCWHGNMQYWWIGNVYDSAVRFAVPVFLMLSGATLLSKDYNLGEFYKHRFSRVFLPFVFWFLVYVAYWWWTQFMPKYPIQGFSASLGWATDLFLKEGISKHFWYIYMILFIYLMVPFLGKWLRKLNMSTLSNLLLLWALLAFALKSIPLNMYSWSGDYGSKLLGYLLYTGYLVFGYYLYKLPTNSPKIRFIAAFVFVISIAVSAVSTYFYSIKANTLDLGMYNYLSINTIIQSVAIFLWVKDITIKNKLISNIQNTISNYSYGIFMVHIIVIDVLFHNRIFWTISNPALSLPLIEILVTVLSIGVIYVLRKIPFGKYVAG